MQFRIKSQNSFLRNCLKQSQHVYERTNMAGKTKKYKEKQ